MAVYVTDPKRILFIHIPKTGGTSIQHWLLTNTNGKPLKARKHHNIDRIKTELELPIDWSFCVVRNPWDCVVSWYWFRRDRALRRMELAKYKNPTGGHKKRKYDLEYNSRVLELHDKGFEYFVETAPTRLCSNKTTGIDTVLKIENIKEDFKIVQDVFNCYNPLGVYNVSKRSRDYRKYYNDHTRKIVEERYAPDIEAFGYKF